MSKTTLEQWRMFKAVVDCGGFALAAKKTHKSQSAVHHAVGKLEESLDLKLFKLDGRKVVLTEEGRLLLKRGASLLTEVDRIESVADSLSSGIETSLTVAIDGAVNQDRMFAALDQVSRAYPQLQIDIYDTVLSGANELLNSGGVDIAISPFPFYNGLHEEICQVEFMAVAHEKHALIRLERPLEFEDLKTCRQIIVRDSALYKNVSAGWLGSEERWTVSNMRTSVELVNSGLGFAWLPSHAIKDDLESGDLRCLPLKEGARRTVNFYLNYLCKDRMGLAAQAFINELSSSLSRAG